MQQECLTKKVAEYWIHSPKLKKCRPLATILHVNNVGQTKRAARNRVLCGHQFLYARLLNIQITVLERELN